MFASVPRASPVPADRFRSEPTPRPATDLDGAASGAAVIVVGAGPGLGRARGPLAAAAADGAVLVATVGAAAVLLAGETPIVPDLLVSASGGSEPLAGLDPNEGESLRRSTLVVAREPRPGALAGFLGEVRILAGLSHASERDDAADAVAALELARRLGGDPVVTLGVGAAFAEGLAEAPDSGSFAARATELGPFLSIENLALALAAAAEARRPAAVRRIAELAAAIGAAGGHVVPWDGRERLRPPPLESWRRPRPSPRRPVTPIAEVAGLAAARVAFVVAVPPGRTLDSEFAGASSLQRTLEALGRSATCERIILLAPSGFDVERLVRRERIGLPLEIDRHDPSPFGPRHAAIVAARRWSDTSWRGGLGGVSVYDECLAPAATEEALARRGLDAAVAVGADWPVVAVTGPGGCDDLVRHHRGDPRGRPLVFTAAPPGLCGILLDRSTLRSLAAAGRDGLLGPRLDPDHPDCLPVDPRVRRSLVRAVFDTARLKIRMRRGLEPIHVDGEELPAVAVTNALENQMFNAVPYYAAQHVELELCTGRFGSGAASPHRWGSIQRAPMSLRRAERILGQLGESGDSILTLGGAGDPLRHPECARIVRMAQDLGVRGVHLRTELIGMPAALDAALDAGVDVVSVDLHAESESTYRAMLGRTGLAGTVAEIERLAGSRRRIDGEGDRALGLPWICPRIQRRPETLAELAPFLARWQERFGAAVVEGPPPADPQPERRERRLGPVPIPTRVAYRELHRRMLILSDGGVPVSELDLAGDHLLGHVDGASILDLWRGLVQRRRQLRREEGPGVEALRVRVP